MIQKFEPNFGAKKTRRLRYDRILGTSLAAAAVVASLFFFKNNIFNSDVIASPIEAKTPVFAYGFLLDSFQLAYRYEIAADESVSDILQKHHVGINEVERLVAECKGIFNPKDIRVGKNYSILSKDSTQSADFLVYEPNATRYVLFDIKNQKVQMIEKKVETVTKIAAGVVQSSLWNTLSKSGLSYNLAAKMEEALKWSVDFHHVRPGDKFKLVFEQNEIEGKPTGVGKLLGAYFQQNEKEYRAIYYEDESHKGFFDADGRAMKKGFLKSPLAFSNISSNFSMARLHPILGDVRPHLGTDYAAPKGTPILAVADGVVEEAKNGGGNGNFVKLRHDPIYETQYLHMSGFAKGIRPGARVQQSQVIGYVGSTGLATGPHVCFRFWKNGAQVNHLNQALPRPQPMSKKDLEKFTPVRDQILSQFDEIEFETTGAQP